MALLTYLLGLVARQLNSIVQAVFGWSVTALFGKLRGRQQVYVTGALIASLAWPVLVAGVISPGVASWAIAFVPLHHWVSDTVLRIVWAALAIAVPLAIGGLVRAAGKYEASIECLVESCRRAGLACQVGEAPRAMVLATSIIRTLARSAVSPLVPDVLRRVTADGLQSAQTLQDRLARLADDLDPARLRVVYADLARADIPYEEWVVLDGLARQLEHRMVEAQVVSPDALPIAPQTAARA